MATARALRLVTSSPSSSTIIRGNLEAVVHRRRSLLSASTTTEAGGAGDPALHSGDAPSEEYTDRPPRFSAATATGGGHASKRQPSPSSEPSKERVPPFAPSGNKLGSHQELADAAADSTFTQRRRFSSSFTQKRQFSSREAATPGGEEAAARKVREEDREYYRTHKPSPLAELEFADTRKPVTQATDGGAADRLDAYVSSATPATVEDTADDSLARAEAMFRDAASRGNPDWPHSREHDAPP
ncbi:hypothetical protein PR202_ga28808 [Eleusine coracana subsp. coracana]|uniref:Uncharacterized protein n=2 Tax=Eleusine coracana subsp. coracana TaxID=191504 RepID=A0AAV9G3S4_ELECO|nr:hypothetical protein QOZ80_UnG0728810 [Eleusine coracana subsp. coracana]KAK3128029.1 hypothetical protein QOZ80_7AG0581650 [Eleusine coracana subsp. coracana]GJN10691.1 hypothetical protein PR202_ga28808 [Eleusine coracana subsp. coracana]